MKLRTKRLDHGIELKILIDHPMETGRRRDEASGLTVPAHYIRSLTVEVNARRVIQADLGTSIARNPYFAFRLGDCRPEDRIKVSWQDNRGGSESQETRVE